MNDTPLGPWVLVVGMHRSGTSAITGALGELGLGLPSLDDRMDWPESNPEHWESLSLSLFNEDLLIRQGGCWDGPPSLPPGSEAELLRTSDPGAALTVAYPSTGPAVWKDPRMCLLLPYWRSVLPDPISAVFVWRSPLAVSSSLQKRDGISIASGLALWERYNRSALEGLDGIDTYVVSYESVVENPSGFVDSIADWLEALEQFTEVTIGRNRKAAQASISADLQHQTQPPLSDEASPMSAQQAQLATLLEQLEGSHRPLHPSHLGRETDWTAHVIDLRREMGTIERNRKAIEEALEEDLRASKIEAAESARLEAEAKRALEYAQRDLEQTKEWLDQSNQMLTSLQESTSWRLTKPLRTSLSKLDKLAHRPADS
jgi:hypothetical protein